MASLDKAEGTLLEIAGVIVLVVLAFIAYGIWKATGAFPSIADILKKFGEFVSNEWQNYKPDFNQAYSGGFGPDRVQTGTNLGVQADGSIGPGPDIETASDNSFIPYGTPLPLDSLGNLPAGYIDPWAGLPPVQLPQIG
jgi:hypothetical protein